MRSLRSLTTVICAALLMLLPRCAAAQTPGPLAPLPGVSQAQPAGLPRVVAMSGTLVDPGGQPHMGAATLSFAFYADQQGGDALWSETQTVQADERGRYTVRLGIETPLPVELFQTAEARWLGVRNAEGVEPPRVRLLSVPYALKAGDAETLGGLPATAYVRAPDTSAKGDGKPEIAAGVAAAGVAGLTANGFENVGSPYATSYGYQALVNNTGTFNAAFGHSAMNANTSGYYNTAVGASAMLFNTSGFQNAAVGEAALFSNVGGHDNTAVGRRAMFSNTNGVNNTATGEEALTSNTVGAYNTATGFQALVSNTTGESNTAQGYRGLWSNTNGFYNTGFGFEALRMNTGGSNNTAVGAATLFSNMTGSGNVALGYVAGSAATGSNNVYVANAGSAGENGAIYLGAEGTHTKTVLAGNVGIGTSAPANKLEVRGSGSAYASITGTGGNAGLIFNNGTGGSAILKSNAADGSFTIDAPLSSEVLRLTPDGKVGINNRNPGNALTVTAAASSYVQLMSLGGNAGHIFTAGGKEAVIRLNIADGSFTWENPNGTERMRITQAGNVGIGTVNPTQPLQMGSGAFVSAGGVWTNASSRALKHDIADVSATQAIDTLIHLQPVSFKYNAEPGRTHIGFIAEDVPELVATEDRKGLAAMDILAVVTKVVQEQQATIQRQDGTIHAQQSTIEELTARLTKLEALVGALTSSANGRDR